MPAPDSHPRSFTSRRMAAAAAAAVSLALLGGCAEDTAATDEGSLSAEAVTKALGAKNPATGSVVKIGFISEGKVEGIDGTASEAAAEATVSYANEYLGGFNGHVAELVTCETQGTPAKATQCGITLAKQGVVAVLVGTSGQDAMVYEALDGTGIPMIVNNTATSEIMGSDRAFVLNNPLGIASAQVAIAQSEGIKKAAIVVVDVPSATGPVESLSRPIYEAAGIDVELVPVSAQSADPTAQVQKAISNGAEQLSVLGGEEFVATIFKTAKQLGFEGPMVTQIPEFTDEEVASIPGGLEGVRTNTNVSKNDDSDRRLYDAIRSTYGVDESGYFPEIGYQTTMALFKAAGDAPDAADADAVMALLQKMPRSRLLPLGNGRLQFQCGVKKVPLLPGLCVSQIVVSTLDAAGDPVDEVLVG